MVGMLQVLTTHWPRFLAGALFAILVSGVVEPPRAGASCGDYVMVNGQSRHNSEPPRPESKPVRGEQDNEPAKVPCPGTDCSGNPAPLSLPVTSVNNHRHDQSDCLVTSGVPSSFGDWEFLTEANRWHRIHHISPIYHPPRSA